MLFACYFIYLFTQGGGYVGDYPDGIYYEYSSSACLTYGILALILGPLVSWLGTMLIYGFGELIDKTVSLENKLVGPEPEPAPKTPLFSRIKKNAAASEAPAPAPAPAAPILSDTIPETLPNIMKFCTQCGAEQPIGNTVCYKCGTRFK